MSINAPQWFKDAVDSWPTAVWLPLPDLKGSVETGDDGYFSPMISNWDNQSGQYITRHISSPDIELLRKRVQCEQIQYPNQLFMPYEKGMWRYINPIELTSAGTEDAALKNGAIIIMGYGIGGGARDTLTTEWYNQYNARISVGDDSNSSYIPSPSAVVKSRYDLQSAKVNGSTFEYDEVPPYTYHDYCLPQFRCAVMGISPSGEVVVGQGHPKYAHMRNRQQDYISIGTISDISNLKAVETYVFNGVGERDLKDAGVTAGMTFFEVLIPGVTPITFPPIGASSWWTNKQYTAEANKNGNVILDKRGFPVGNINYTPGTIPPDPAL